MQNILFVCSRNKRRSLTAEMVFKKNEHFQVKSCGTSSASRVKINEKLIRWADVVLVMEKRHKEIVLQQFQAALRDKEINVLFIPDEYELMDDDLVDLLHQRLMELGFISS